MDSAGRSRGSDDVAGNDRTRHWIGAQEISTVARRDGDEYVINGEKRWVGNGSRSDWVATLCRTDPDVERDHEGLSLIVVPTDTDGFDGEPIDKMGLIGNDNAELTYDDVRVPRENLLGDEERRGFYQVLDWLNEGHGRIAVSAARHRVRSIERRRTRPTANRADSPSASIRECAGSSPI